MNYTLDPNKFYSHAADYQILEACGLLPRWISESDTSIREALDTNYAFAGGFQPFEGPSLDAQGRFVYPGDPPLEPYIEIRKGDETFRQYPHGLVALTTGDKTEFARLD